MPGAEDRPPALLPVAGRAGHRRRARSRRTGRTRCSTPTATTRSSATGSWPTRPATPAQPMAERTAWRICSQQRLVERVRQAQSRGQERQGPARRCTTTWSSGTSPPTAPNRLWLADITEHRTGEGKLYLCAIKDVYSNRIVGYSIDSRMKSRLAVTALDNAVARARRRRPAAWCTPTAGRNSAAGNSSTPSHRHHMVGSMGRVGAAGDNAAMESFFAPAAEERPRPPHLGHPPRAADRDRDLDRTDLPPPPTPRRPRPIDPYRVRDHHDHTSHSGRVTQPVTYRCSSPVADAGRSPRCSGGSSSSG